MDRPAVTTVQFDTITFNAFSTEFSMSTPYDGVAGMPLMGQAQTTIQIFVDMHDNENLSFEKIKLLFANAPHVLTSESIKDCKITFWADDQKQNALSTFSFKGWMTHFGVMSGGGQNHLLMIKLQPKLDQKQFMDISHGN